MSEIITEYPIDVSWFIDTTPDYSLINNFTETNIANFNDSITIIAEQFTASEEEHVDCFICMESRENNKFCQLNCGHYFCGICIRTIIGLPQAFHCPLCRVKVSNIKNFTH
jgi:late competence protein required for DNA uptake (superfamily II DNA/RNA helicase)